MTTEEALAADRKPTVVDVQEDIAIILADLEALVPMVEDLTEAGQPGLGVLTFEAREALDRQTRAEHAEIHTKPIRRDNDGNVIVGLDWLNHQLHSTLGPKPAPGNFGSIAVDADMWFTLWHQVRRVTRTMELSGVPVPTSRGWRRGTFMATDDHGHVIAGDTPTVTRWFVQPRPAGFIGPMNLTPVEVVPAVDDLPTTTQLIHRLSVLVKAAPSMKLLRPLKRELKDLWDKAEVAVEGARVVFVDDCPWCQRPTLFMFRRDDLVRCDRVAGAKHYKPCVCADPLCPCHVNPRGFRHTWRRAANEYQVLERRLTFIRRIKEPQQMTAAQARQAVEYVRALHRPFWIEVVEHDDTTTTEVHHDYAVEVDPDTDHVCRRDGEHQCDPATGVHYALACMECVAQVADGEPIALLWPCPTARALSGVDVAGERAAEEAARLAAEQEADEAAAAADAEATWNPDSTATDDDQPAAAPTEEAHP